MPEATKATSEDSLSMGDIYYLLFRHKLVILVCLMLGMLAAAILFYMTPNVFRSEARLLVRYVTEATVLDPAATGDRMISPGRGGENVINSEIQILTSRDLVEKVVDDMGVLRFEGGESNAVNRLRVAELIQERLLIEVPKNSNIISISFDGIDPVISQEFLKRLTDAYLARHAEIHRSVGAYEFLSQQTDQLRSKLAETEEELRRIKYSEGIVSIAESKKNVAARCEELTKGLGDLEASLAASLARVEYFKGLPLVRRVATGNNSLQVMTTTNEGPSELLMRLQRLRQKETELLGLYTADSIPVVTLRSQIKETERMIDEGKSVMVTTNRTPLPKEGISPAAETPDSLLEESAMIASLRAKMKVQKELLKQSLDEAKRIDAVEAKITQLERNKELQEANYKYFSQSLEHARIDDALNSGKISNISVVQPATLPTQPFRPNLPKRVGLALFLGLVVGVGFAMAREYVFDHTIRKASELRAKLRFPVLVSVPQVDARRYSLRASREAKLLAAHDGDKGGVQDEWGPQRDLQAYCETLRDRLVMTIGMDFKAPYVLGITSCIRGSGVSTLATGLALELSRSGDTPVLLINGGENASLPKVFGVNPFAGVTDVVAQPDGNTALVQRNMYLVPAGDAGRDWTGATPAQRLTELIQFARNSASRFVIVDLPPVEETSLAVRMSGLLDGVLLVIAAEKVNCHAAGHAVELLGRSGGTIIGTVLNQRRQYVPAWLYHRR
jgi:uncharacterized protein involved in exopolysaccharide biosynthesis/Mrp family chromosome partitioning ATPase